MATQLTPTRHNSPNSTTQPTKNDRSGFTRCLSIELTPGLFNMNLNLMYVLDISMIYDEIEALSIRRQVEHSCVKNVLQIMIAILKTKLPRERYFAKKLLEYILEEDPENLNALADLEHIYRSLHLLSDAEICKSKKERILNGSEESSQRSKSICLMEQGYAILHDISANVENIANSKLTDAHKMLQTEHNRSTDERRNLLGMCVFHNQKTTNILEQSMNCYRINPYFIRKTNSIQNFETALAMYDKLPYKNAWSYYIGEAWNRHVDSLQKLSSHDGISRHKDIAEATCKAMEIFFQILNMKEDMEKKNTYVSRSLAHIGHILIKRSKILDRMKTDYTFFKDKSYIEFHDNPMIPLEKAYKMQMRSPDSFILNRYGRALFNLAMKSNCSENLNNLKKAECLLSTSISYYAMNWFAYCTRMQVMDELGNLYLKQYKTKLAWDSFARAMDDGHECFLAKGLSTDMVNLAKICQKMSKFPKVRQFGGTFVKDKTYLYKALEYLNHGIASEGLYDCKLANQLASCLYDLNEYNSAAEWMKRTLALAIKPNAFMYKITCLYVLKRYAYERKENKKYCYLLKEMVYIFLDCKKKCGNLETIYEYIVRNSCPELFLLLTDAIMIPNLLRLDGFEIIKDLLKFATNPDNMEHKLNSVDANKFRELQEQVCEKDIRIHVLEDTEKDPEEIFQYSAAPIPMSRNTSLVSEGYQYDFFISHSQKDSDWVYNMLLFELENKAYEEDFAFKGKSFIVK